MELADLNHDERLALLGLAEVVVASNREATEGEAAHVSELVAVLGEDTYRACLDEVEERFREPADLKAFLAGIARREARDLIFAWIQGLALADAVTEGEENILEWLAAEWDVRVQYGDQGT